MGINQELTQETFEDDKYEEEWTVVTNTKGRYTLSKIQARILQQEIATGNRGIIMFKTFSISIPYVVEFYREKRYLKEAKQLSAKLKEEEFKPMDPEAYKKLKEEIYAKVGKPMK